MNFTGFKPDRDVCGKISTSFTYRLSPPILSGIRGLEKRSPGLFGPSEPNIAEGDCHRLAPAGLDQSIDHQSGGQGSQSRLAPNTQQVTPLRAIRHYFGSEYKHESPQTFCFFTFCCYGFFERSLFQASVI